MHTYAYMHTYSYMYACKQFEDGRLESGPTGWRSVCTAMATNFCVLLSKVCVCLCVRGAYAGTYLLRAHAGMSLSGSHADVHHYVCMYVLRHAPPGIPHKSTKVACSKLTCRRNTCPPQTHSGGTLHRSPQRCMHHFGLIHMRARTCIQTIISAGSSWVHGVRLSHVRGGALDSRPGKPMFARRRIVDVSKGAGPDASLRLRHGQVTRSVTRDMHTRA